jgi:DNA-directed RNA polymerase specialized sigma24 family protein
MKPIRIPTLSPEQLDALETLYRTTREARLRTRAQMVLLAAEQRLTAAEIAEIVRASEETVRRFISNAIWPRESRVCTMYLIRVLPAR